MEFRMRFRLCPCCRHGYFAHGETGERLTTDVFSQEAAVSTAKLLAQQFRIQSSNIDVFYSSIRETGLPAKDPQWLDELVVFDTKLNISIGNVPSSEEEIRNNIHGLLETCFPRWRTLQ